jgi:hypothetical protein
LFHFEPWRKKTVKIGERRDRGCLFIRMIEMNAERKKLMFPPFASSIPPLVRWDGSNSCINRFPVKLCVDWTTFQDFRKNFQKI